MEYQRLSYRTTVHNTLVQHFRTLRKTGFNHSTSSPHYPQGNGKAERGVQTMKRLLSGSQDPYLALLAYRATPLRNGYSPSELLMGRKLRTTLPESPANLSPKWPDLEYVRDKERIDRTSQRHHFDRSHRTVQHPELHPGETVWVKGPGGGFSGTITKSMNDRSYFVSTPSGQIRRNRRQLVQAPAMRADNPHTSAGCGDLPSDVKEPNAETMYNTPVKAPKPAGSPKSKTVSNASVHVSNSSEIGVGSRSDNVITTRSGRVSVAPNRMDL
ncbi:uncharacterized protein LOC132555454 [Ylistrum balloti]|uniref:uncharacterized protein LOC132555454 n=1 Tax=Ylistrum balloti TaxID=509963 RepID=UPI002905E1F5|nr:uncharacterized protein LOC132555454 [Ylistrum balloti]